MTGPGWWRDRRVRIGAATVAGVGALATLLAVGTGSAPAGGPSWRTGAAEVAGPAVTAAGGTAVAGPPAAPGGPAGVGPSARPGAPPPARIHPFAQDLDRSPNPVRRSPTAPVTIAEGVDGCDHGYGEPTICVPWEFPAGVTDACDWLRERDYPPLAVLNPRDRHKLDTNGDGTGCGPGD